jgi:hypothetical protein
MGKARAEAWRAKRLAGPNQRRRRVATLEAALREIRREADGTNYLNSPQTSCALIVRLVDDALADTHAQRSRSAVSDGVNPERTSP